MAGPTDDEILAALRPHLPAEAAGSVSASDVGRLAALLELENEWPSLSHKRVTTILVSCGHLAPPASAAAGSQSTSTSTSSSSSKKKKKKKTPAHVPRSFIADPVLREGVEAVYFNAVKGKGLVATRAVREGSVVFTDEALVPTPPPSVVSEMLDGRICTQCFLPTEGAGAKVCVKACGARFCSLLCQSRAMATHHALLCTKHNARASRLIDTIRAHNWQSLHSVARCVARLILTAIHEPDAFAAVDRQLASFATVSELERRARNPGWSVECASFSAALDSAHAALVAAFQHRIPPSATPPVAARLTDILSHSAFLHHLGRSNINMESHGGLYPLHSFLNHDCSPNLSIRHIPVRGRLASMKIAALATRDIAPGQELTISYIDPSMPVTRRRLLLWRDYCFGPCTCERCTTQADALDPQERKLSEHPQLLLERENRDAESKASASQSQSQSHGADRKLDGLEDELRTSLGF